jgi:hypothetical protein
VSLIALVLPALIGLTAQAAPPAILQRGYDAGLSGANLSETLLNTSNVAPSTFGMVFKLPVDDAIFAQPLYVPGVPIINQGTHNVVYVATMSDTLYAFDADAGGSPLWSVNLARGAAPVPAATFSLAGNRNIVGNIGILSTPVIDPSTNVIYLVTCTLENGTMAYRLHAVDITAGTEPYGPGVLITGAYGGSTFNARYLTQRVSLTLSGDQVVFAFGALQLEGTNTYSGWVLAYNKHTLQQSGAFATQTTGPGGGGVWQSGRPPAVDKSGNVYVFTGNGYGSGYDGVRNFSESAIKLDPARGLRLIDWFTPGNWSDLDSADSDLTGSGPLLIPGTSLLAGGGKGGILYVLNTANLGKFNAFDSQIVQEESISAQIRSGPVYWQRSAASGGPRLYHWGLSDAVKAFAFDGTKFAATPSSSGSGAQSYPGGTLALSANGEQHGSGVLWATVSASGNAENDPPTPGALHAFDAEDVSRELWNSSMKSSRDGFGNFAKFVPPLVANGRVYVATWSNQVAVYGLFSSFSVSPPSLAFGNQTANQPGAPMAVTVTNTGTVALPIKSISLSPAGPQPYSQTNTCGTSVPVGGHCAVNVVFDPATAGSASATLSINTSGGAGTQTVTLAGTGVVESYSVSPVSLVFGSQAANQASAPQAVTITNTSTIPLPISGITISPAGPQPYTQTNTCGASVAAGAQCLVNVVFNPASPGSASGTLTISAGAVPSTVSLSGSGTFQVMLATGSQSVTANMPNTLTWSSIPNASCTPSGGVAGDGWTGSLPASGSRAIAEAVPGNYNYSLSCVAQGVEASANVTVTVTASRAADHGGGALDATALLCLLGMLLLQMSRQVRDLAPMAPTGARPAQAADHLQRAVGQPPEAGRQGARTSAAGCA